MASIVWAAYGYMSSMGQSAQTSFDMSYLDYQLCMREPEPRTKDCGQIQNDNYKLFMKGSTEIAATKALAPIPIAWLLVYFVLFLVRWVRAGFRQA